VRDALDLTPARRTTRRIDDAIQASAGDIDRLCKRIFWPQTAARTFDWPDPTSPTPWRLWLDQSLGDPPMPDLATITTITSGDTTIPPTSVLLRPDDGPPYGWIELDTSTTDVFGQSDTWQRDITITGIWTRELNTADAGTLTAAITTTTATTASISDSAAVGVGDLLTIDTERIQVTGKTWTDTTQTAAGTGLTARNDSQTLQVTGGTWHEGETLLIGSEHVQVEDIAGTTLLIHRAVDGTTLAAHTAGTAIWAPRTITIERAAAGTTAATHSDGATLTRNLPPAPINQLAVGLSLDTLLQQATGYSRTVGSGDNARNASGSALRDLRERVRVTYGRKGRADAI
jgi:hypothetical protein